MISFFQKLNGLDVPGLKWKEQKSRGHARIVSFSRFDSTNVSGGKWGWNYTHGNPDAITLAINKAVFFHGVRLIGDSKGSKYDVKFTIKDENVTGTYTSKQHNDGVWGYDVMLPRPISILPDKDVTIMALINGPESHGGNNGKLTVKFDDIVVTFKDAPPGVSANSTNQSWGQFYKIFLGCYNNQRN